VSTPRDDSAGRHPLPDKGLIERALSPIADVRRGEAASALVLTLTMFLLLGGYYLLKTAREGFILSESSAELKSYSSALQAVLLLFVVPAYGRLASHFNRLQLVQWVTLFYAFNLVLFVFALTNGMRIGIIYFLWLGIFNVMVIAQFWGFAADLMTEEQGKRLFPLIGVGSSLGAWVGSLRAGQLVQHAGGSRLLMGGAALLVLCALLARVANRLSVRQSVAQQKAADQKLTEGGSGFGVVLKSRYLLLVAALVILLNVVNTSGEYLFGRYVVDAANAAYGTGVATRPERERFISGTYGSYYATANLLGLLLQLFVVSRVFKMLGVAGALFIHPLIGLGGYLMMLRAPSLSTIRPLKIADNAVAYSLGNTTTQALWLPTSRETKYKAKQVIDSFCVRAGDVLQAAIVYSGELLALSVGAFAALNIVFVILWLAVVRGLGRHLRRPAEDPVTRAA
jgi:AAA family ATP:ADP antiporter